MSTDRYDEAMVDKVADEIRYFLLQEAATDRPWDFAEHIVAALADAGLLIPPGSHRRTDLKDGYTHRRTVIFTPWTEVPAYARTVAHDRGECDFCAGKLPMWECDLLQRPTKPLQPTAINPDFEAFLTGSLPVGVDPAPAITRDWMAHLGYEADEIAYAEADIDHSACEMTTDGRCLMGQQIIQQPNGQYAIFSTITDTIVMWDADAGDIEEYFVERAAKQERGRVRDILKHVTAGRPEKAYYQFVMTWADALQMDEVHGGEAWQDPATRTETS